jgi:hypothetical protein
MWDSEPVEKSLKLLLRKPVGCLSVLITVLSVVSDLFWSRQDWGGCLGFFGFGGMFTFIGYQLLQILPSWKGYEDRYLRRRWRFVALGWIVLGSICLFLGVLMLIGIIFRIG